MEGSLLEIANNSVSSGGGQRYLIRETGSYEKMSTLTITKVRTEDSGQYTCVSQNYAGRVEANFTLQVSTFTYSLIGKSAFRHFARGEQMASPVFPGT